MWGMVARDIGENMRRIQGQLPSLAVAPPPAPWRHVTTRAVGGLYEVGFGTASNLLLIISSSGRGVMDALTGEMRARDRSEGFEWFDARELLAQGIGPLGGQTVRVAGLAGGGLAATTSDGWSVEAETFAWPERCVILKHPDWYEFVDASAGCTKLAVEFELRAWGFSPTGRCVVVATSSEVYVYARA